MSPAYSGLALVSWVAASVSPARSSAGSLSVPSGWLFLAERW